MRPTPSPSTGWVTLAMVGCSTPGPVDGRGRTVLLLTLDTLREDFVGPQDGMPSSLTPHLDRLPGTRFGDATTAAPLTLPAHVSMLTGQQPNVHGVLRNNRVLDPQMPVVTSMLAEDGFRTAAFVSSAVLSPVHGLNRGFARYVAPEDERQPGAQTVKSALQWVEQQPPAASLFLWVHLYDTHAPTHVGKARAPDLPSPCVWSAHPTAARLGTGNPFRANAAPLPPTEACVRSRAADIEGYAAAVRNLDDAVGVLVDGLKALDRFDAAVVAADHGESLVEHQMFSSHQFSLYEPVQQIPLWVVAPGGQQGRSDVPVTLTRVAPTLLDLAGAASRPDWPPSLRDATPSANRIMVGPAPAERGDVPRPNALQATARTGSLVVLVDDRDHVERYDLERDPQQRAPCMTQPEQERMRARIVASLAPNPLDGTRWIGKLPGVDKADPTAALLQPGVLGQTCGDVTAWDELFVVASNALVVNSPAASLDDDATREVLTALGYEE